MTTRLALAQTRNHIKFWEKQRPINIPAASDTYKRNMSGSSDVFADNLASYTLAARKALKEPGAEGRLITAGLEKVLYPWFMFPVEKEEIEEAEEFFLNKASVRKFPSNAWKKVLDNDGFLPLDVYGLPGGQTFLVKDGKYVPTMSIEGPGALASHVEPQFLTSFKHIIYATKARLMKESTGEDFAEFGLRADDSINDHAMLMLSLYVGGKLKYTSDDQAVFLFPELFKDIGTVGHELAQTYQKKGRTLEEAQRLAYMDFLEKNDTAALLPDIVNTRASGFPLIKTLAEMFPEKNIFPRLDSEDVPEQCVDWAKFRNGDMKSNRIVVEDGYNPEKARETKSLYAAAGANPKDIFTGAGGYFQEGNTRDAISMAYKRGATLYGDVWEDQIKFSDTKAKNSIPGRPRVWEQGRTLIVAQAGEKIDGTMLTQKLVENGGIKYRETLDAQADRADATWNKYNSIEYSPMTLAIMDERQKEKDSILERLGVKK